LAGHRDSDYRDLNPAGCAGGRSDESYIDKVSADPHGFLVIGLADQLRQLLEKSKTQAARPLDE
jgi:hypothetical protein